MRCFSLGDACRSGLDPNARIREPLLRRTENRLQLTLARLELGDGLLRLGPACVVARGFLIRATTFARQQVTLMSQPRGFIGEPCDLRLESDDALLDLVELGAALRNRDCNVGDAIGGA